MDAPTVVQFTSWLYRHRGEANVGFPRAAGDCPLARYMREATGLDVFVNGLSANATENGVIACVDIPDVLTRFIYLLDQEPRNKPVSAARALTLLSAVR